MQHFINISDLTLEQLAELLDRAQNFIGFDNKILDHTSILRGKTVAMLFFENSTRTQCSFELAAKKLGAHVVKLDIATSSTRKGETLFDTLANLCALGVDIFVIRHGENGIMQKIAYFLGQKASLVNAGEGNHAHPTQGLLDILTIRQYKKNFSNLIVTIAGDILHSRVVRSQMRALQLLGVKEIRLVGPENLLPKEFASAKINLFTSFDEALINSDVISMVRLQVERMENTLVEDLNYYTEYYQLTPERLALAKPDAIVMHPGPMNRDVEIANSVADGKQSVILQQVHNGLAARMAVLASFK